MKRIRINIQGHVQGVGFRPHVYRITQKLALTGWIKNNAAGVCIEVQGNAINDFLHRLLYDLPSLAKIEHMNHITIPAKVNEMDFVIAESELGEVTAKITADTTICQDCLNELFDTRSHYYRYPFINCTNCGPRYTITQHLPYDRGATSMAEFIMCHRCRSAYTNPLDRRYHAQAIACSHCGPKLSHDINDIAQIILAGKIVAIKGLGGYQIICNASHGEAIKRLRKNKGRLTKPFALMVLNSVSAEQIVHCSSQEKQLLTSCERPIVILRRKNNALPHALAPRLNSFGIMLPSTPIHYLLFNALLGSPDGTTWLEQANEFVLIVTSANPSSCPLIKEDLEAEKKLSTIVDVVVSYNRNIIVRVDDSVLKVVADKPVFIRRARGYVPQAIPLPYDIPTTLALGAYLKNTVCITRGREAFISQHIGDLNLKETRRCYRETIDHLLKVLNVKPECVAHDLHPDFYSTQISSEYRLPTFAVQHHHAHLAACAAEHGIVTDAIGLALDGFGIGESFDNRGGELLHYHGVTYDRLGSFKPLLQPGGEVAIRQPWRMAASILFELGKIDEITKRFATQRHAKPIIEILTKQINSPLTTSCGRLFDAASALLGLCEIAHYEGEAAIMLENKVTDCVVASSGWCLQANQLNLIPLFSELITCDAICGANLFHGTLAAALVEWVKQNIRVCHTNYVLMAGGCFLNKILTEKIITALRTLQLKPLYPRLCPPNDGGISLGQAWIAGNKMMEMR